MSRDPIVTKPESGRWADAFPELGRGPVSFDDCVSEEFYEKEREHVFRKSWLYMGRVEQLPNRGSYFTRELRFMGTSIIIVRGKFEATGTPVIRGGILAANVDLDNASGLGNIDLGFSRCAIQAAQTSGALGAGFRSRGWTQIF